MTEYKPIPELNESVANAFWSKVAFTANPNMCWNWTGRIRSNEKPYGRFNIGDKNIFSANRLAYFFHNKVDPKELHALHTCDNPKCCNPAHLFLGTNADNVADKVSKGRQARNEAWNKGKKTIYGLWNNSNSVLTEKQYHEIMDLYNKKGLNAAQISKIYSMTRQNIAKAIKRMGGTLKRATQLTKEDVLEIRGKYIPNIVSSKTLSKEYGVGSKTILDIFHRRTWNNI